MRSSIIYIFSTTVKPKKVGHHREREEDSGLYAHMVGFHSEVYLAEFIKKIVYSRINYT